MPHRAPGCASGASYLAISPLNALPCVSRKLTSPPLHGLAVDMALRYLLHTAVSAMPLRHAALLHTHPKQLLPTAASATLLLFALFLGKPPRCTTMVLGRRELPKGLGAPPKRTASTTRMILTSSLQCAQAGKNTNDSAFVDWCFWGWWERRVGCRLWSYFVRAW